MVYQEGNQFGTKFEPGNQAAKGHTKKFYNKEFLEGLRGMLFEGDIPLALQVMKQILIGYKEVKPSDRVAILQLALAYGLGKPKETVAIEDNREMREKTDQQLMADFLKDALQDPGMRVEVQRILLSYSGEKEKETMGGTGPAGGAGTT